MSGIVETFFGEYIDLDKVVTISKAKFTERVWGYSKDYVGFEIKCQLLIEPIVYERYLEDDEYHFDLNIETVESSHKIIYGDDNSTPLAVIRLQKQIDHLVQQWIEHKKSKGGLQNG